MWSWLTGQPEEAPAPAGRGSPSKDKRGPSNNIRQPAELKPTKSSAAAAHHDSSPKKSAATKPAASTPKKLAEKSTVAGKKKAKDSSLDSVNRRSLTRTKVISAVLLVVCLIAIGVGVGVKTLMGKWFGDSSSSADSSAENMNNGNSQQPGTLSPPPAAINPLVTANPGPSVTLGNPSSGSSVTGIPPSPPVFSSSSPSSSIIISNPPVASAPPPIPQNNPTPSLAPIPPSNQQPPPSPPSNNDNLGAALSASATAKLQQADWSQILTSQQPDLSYKPSSIYFSADFIDALKKMVQTGVGSQKMWFGDGNDVYGLVSAAAFLAQSMKETIKYDACDENNWDMTSAYSAANACGQLGQAYDKYTCSGEDAGRECRIDPNKVVVARTSAKWYGAPGPMFAAPKSLVPKAPKWNYGSPWCNPAQTLAAFTSDMDYVKAIAKMDGSADCRMYPGQKAGGWELCGGQACPNVAATAFNVPARTDVEGCYFWGRGVIQTTGICNYGKLNYYAGKLAATSNRASLYPDVDFCADPEAICTSTKYPELKWFAGLFYWVNAVQDYDDGKWNFKTELKKFVDGGFKNAGVDSGFIRGVSGIVNRGCADPPNCGTGPLDGGMERAQNFEKVLKAFKLI